LWIGGDFGCWLRLDHARRAKKGQGAQQKSKARDNGPVHHGEQKIHGVLHHEAVPLDHDTYRQDEAEDTEHHDGRKQTGRQARRPLAAGPAREISSGCAAPGKEAAAGILYRDPAFVESTWVECTGDVGALSKG
jgi:hypothetical protein